jgi:hypothetical protein
MTDAEITIAMAEVEGYTPSDSPTYPNLWYPPRKVGKGRGNDELSILPSYLTDANTVLRVLTSGDSAFQYAHHTGTVFYWPGNHPVTSDGFMGINFDADPVRRFCRAACEAVLRAHGKWRDA